MVGSYGSVTYLVAQLPVGYCGKTGRKNGAMECSNIGARKGTLDAVKLVKVERSRAVRRYADVKREDVQTPLGQNRLIIPYFIYFIKIYLHWVTPGPRCMNPLYQRHGRLHGNQLS